MTLERSSVLVTKIIAATMNINEDVTQQVVAISRSPIFKASRKTQTLTAKIDEPSSLIFIVHQFL